VPTNAKLTIKQERFVAEYLKDGNASRAYREAYDAENMLPNVIHVKACELLKTGKVAVSVDLARKRMAAKVEITHQKIIEMLIEDREFAQSLKNASAATAASMSLAKVTGHLTEDKKNMRLPLQDMSTEMLLELEAALVQSLRRTQGTDESQPVDSVTH